MREKSLKLWLVSAAVALLMPLGAEAAGLGRLIVHSTLGQPLNAEVELLSVQKGETITGRLSSPDVYQQANVQFNNALIGTRVSVERRSNGQAYLKITSSRTITEPFIEILIEINSENGRVVRQYTTLLDPPGYGRQAGDISPPVASGPETPPPVAAVPAATSPYGTGVAEAPRGKRPAAKVEAAPKPEAAPRSEGMAGARQYGPIKPGETLGVIARQVKPEGVSLEQALVGLYNQNPDAFIKKNMNLVRSGRILTVPEASAFAAIGRREAAQEVKTHVADWNTYRNRLADRAAPAKEEGRVASGKIGTVADRTAEGPRDTVRLSKGADAKGKGAEAERVRALEEEAVARNKQLTEANARIAQLERIVKDSQKAAELKGVPPPKPGEKPAVTVPPPPVKAPDVAKAPEPPKPEPAKAEPAKGAEPPKPADKGLELAKETELPKGDIAKGEPVKPAAPMEPADPTKLAEAPKGTAPPTEPPAAKAKKVAPPPEPAPEPSLVDELFSQPLYLALAGGLVLLGGVGLIVARRRRQSDALDQDLSRALKVEPASKPSAAETAEPAPGAKTALAAASARAAAATEPPASADEPAATTEAPKRDAAATATGDNDLDFNAEEGGSAPERAPAAATASTRVAPPLVTPVAPPLAPVAAPAPRPAPPPPVVEVPRAPEPPRAPAPAAMDFSLDTPSTAPAARFEEPKAAPAAPASVPDLDLDTQPMALDKVSSEPPQSVDFKLDLADLSFGEAPKAAPTSSTKRDDHWYDVQQKFDLAKAYQEMGDKDGAREILREVVREGDAEQQGEANKLLGTLA